MNAVLLVARKRTYLIWALFGFVVVGFALSNRITGELMPEDWQFVWQISTGLLLFLALGYQWILLVLRLTRPHIQRPHYLAHRWVGVGATFLFAVHAVRFGYNWTSWLAIVFILSAATGVLNKEVIPYKSRTLYLVWFWFHITLAFMLIPLVLIHIWVALAYEGF